MPSTSVVGRRVPEILGSTVATSAVVGFRRQATPSAQSHYKFKEPSASFFHTMIVHDQTVPPWLKVMALQNLTRFNTYTCRLGCCCSFCIRNSKLFLLYQHSLACSPHPLLGHSKTSPKTLFKRPRVSSLRKSEFLHVSSMPKPNSYGMYNAS